MPAREKFLAIAVLAATIAALATGFELVGQTARAVDVLTLFAGGVTAGVSLVTLVQSMKARRRDDSGVGR